MIGMRKRVLMVALATAGMTVGYATPAAAQATRTWVSGVGDDVNPCSRTAPCKTFAGAISKTAVGGEINCLDPGGFGAVTITKSLTISCPYTEGGALAGGNGITINDALSAAGPNTADVFLRGLDIFGVNPPTNGVRFVSGRSLQIEDSTIRRFNAASSAGVSFAPAGASKLYMHNVTVSDNGNAATGGGIVIAPAVGGSAQAVLTNVRARNNANHGLRADSTNGAVGVLIENSDFSGNATGISGQGTTNNLRMMVEGSSIAANSGFGINLNGATAILRIGDTSVTNNATGVIPGSGQIISFGTNRIIGNPTVGAPNDGVISSGQLQN
jgi:hypothetical protein